MKNVLIISYFFPPINKIAARRYGQMVDFMEENGWKPWVLTKDFEGDLAVPLTDEQVIRISSGSGVPGKGAVKSNKMSFMKKSLRTLGFKPLTIDSTLKWSSAVKQQFPEIKGRLPEIDMVLSTFGPACAFELGIFFKNHYSCPAVLDFRDMAAFNEENKNVISIMLDRFIEKKYVKEYDWLVTVSPTLKSILNENYSCKKTDVIFNGWFESRKIESSSEINEKYIYYAGRIYPHRVKGLEFLLKSMKVSQEDIKLKIRSVSVKWVEDEFLKIVDEMGMKDRVEFLEECDSRTAEIESENAYINLIVEDLDTTSYWTKGNMTGKFMQLMPLEPPLLSIARADNDMGPILDETGRGKLCSTVDDIKGYLNDLEENYDKYRINLKKMNKYSKKAQALKLCSIFNDLTGNVK